MNTKKNIKKCKKKKEYKRSITIKKEFSKNKKNTTKMYKKKKKKKEWKLI